MQLKTTSSLVLALALVCGSGAAFAQGMSKTGTQDMTKAGKPMTAQQEKMKSCSADAKAQGLKGKAYTDFKNTCLKDDSPMTAASPAAAAPMAASKPMSAKESQREKMKTCNADAKAKGLKGKDYTSYRNTCLKGDASAGAAH